MSSRDLADPQILSPVPGCIAPNQWASCRSHFACNLSRVAEMDNHSGAKSLRCPRLWHAAPVAISQSASPIERPTCVEKHLAMHDQIPSP